MSLKLDVLKECLESARAQVTNEVTDAVLAELITMQNNSLAPQDRLPPDSTAFLEIKIIALAFRRAKNLEERN